MISGGIQQSKSCSICGKEFNIFEFEYGNRKNRSYCRSCNKEEKAAYSRGGVEAAKEYRDNMRANYLKNEKAS